MTIETPIISSENQCGRSLNTGRSSVQDAVTVICQCHIERCIVVNKFAVSIPPRSISVVVSFGSVFLSCGLKTCESTTGLPLRIRSTQFLNIRQLYRDFMSRKSGERGVSPMQDGLPAWPVVSTLHSCLLLHLRGTTGFYFQGERKQEYAAATSSTPLSCLTIHTHAGPNHGYRCRCFRAVGQTSTGISRQERERMICQGEGPHRIH